MEAGFQCSSYGFVGVTVTLSTYLAASFLTAITGLPRREKKARLKSATAAGTATAVPAVTRDSMDSRGTTAGLTRVPDDWKDWDSYRAGWFCRRS